MNVGRAKWWALAITVLLLAACMPAAAPTVNTSPLPAQAEATPGEGRREATPAASPPGSGARVSGVPGDLLNAILADASQRMSLDADALVVTRAEATTWNDGSLGCPEPGMFYTQALVDGYQIVIEAGGQSLDYRAGDNQYFRLCEN